MKILVLAHRFPFPPTDGARIRSFHMIAHLHRAHQVTVAAPTRSPAEAAAGAGLAEHCHAILTDEISRPAAMARMLLNLPTATPSSMGYFHAPGLARAVREAIARERFDLIVCYCSSMGPYVQDVTATPKLLDFADMDSQKWLAYAGFHGFPRSVGYWLEGRKLAAAEAALARCFDCCTCITQAELQTLLSFGVDCETDWFPNGVDLDYFARGDQPYDPEQLSFIGRMDYYPNQNGMTTFCHEVLPRIRVVRPAVKLTIVGAEPPQAIRDLGTLPGVTVTGTVPDVRPFTRHAAATVAPLSIARGTQNKILESWALGVPVVASSRAAAGVDAVAGEHLLVADDPGDFAAAVLRVMGDPGERRRLADAGRRRVETLYTWDVAMARFDRAIEAALARHRDRRGEANRAA